MTEERHSFIFKICTAVMISFVFVYLIIGEFILPSEVSFDYSECEVLESLWYKVNTYGQKVTINFPYTENSNEEVTFVGTLPDKNLNNTWLMFWNPGHVLKVYVDDELRYSYDTSGSRIFGDKSPHCYIFTELRNDDSGREIKIKAEADGKGVYYPVYIGDQYSLIEMATSKYKIEVVLAIFLLFMGFMCAVTSIIVEILFKQPVDMKYFSMGVIVMALWILTNDGIRQFLLPNISVVRDVAYFCVAVMPLPFMIFINTIQKKRYSKIYLGAEAFIIIDFIISIALYTMNIAGFGVLRYSIIAVGFVSLILIISTLVLDLLGRKIYEYARTAVAFAIIAATCGVQLGVYVFMSDRMYNGVMLEIGLFVGLMISIINLVYQMMDLNAQKNQAVRASKEKNNFLASMSHEIRTPINSVLGMNEMILRESKEIKIKEYAANIENSGSMLLSLINDILDFSKIESGKMEIVSVDYQLSSLLNDLVNMVYSRAEKKRLDFRMNIDPNVPEYLYGDEVRIKQIITNLLTNGIKYTDTGFVELSLEYKMLSKDKLELIIKVSDSGRGIREDEQKKLFMAFQRVSEVENRNIEGTGLGLAITNHFVTAMGGTIDVMSKLGHGSVFTVRLPQTIVENVAMGDFRKQFEKNLKEREVYRESFQAPDAKVLIVDDNNMNLMVAEGLLKQTRIQVTCAESGRECIELLKKFSYDLVLLDHMMPELDGVDTLSRIRRFGLARNVPIIALTANAVSGAKEMYLDYGFSDYLSKPILGKALERMLIKWLPDNKIIPKGELKHNENKSKELDDNNIIVKFKFLDVETGLKYCMEDEEFYENMLTEYANSSKMDSLNKFVKDKDWENYRILIHALKSNSLNIGATEVSEEARKLEEAVKNGDYDYVILNHEVTMKKYDNIINSLLVAL